MKYSKTERRPRLVLPTISPFEAVSSILSQASSPAQVRRLFILSTFRLAYMLRICLVSSPSPCLLYRIVVSWYGLHRAAMYGLAKRNENEVSSLFFLSSRERCSGEEALQDSSINVGPIGWKLGRIISLTNRNGVTYRFVDTFCLAHTRTLQITNVEREREAEIEPRLSLHHILFIEFR